MRSKATSSYLDLESLALAEESWTEQQVEVFQLTELRRTIRMAENSCPFYQRRFAQHGVSYLDLYTAKDLSLFPVLTQNELDENLDDLLNPNFGRKFGRRSPDRKTAANSSGLITATTVKGIPSEQKEKVFLEQLLRRLGVTDRDRIVFIWDEFNMGKARSRHLSVNLRKRWLTLSAQAVTPNNASAHLDKVIGFKPDVIVGYPAALLSLALELQRSKRSFKNELKTVLSSGECLTSPQKRFLEEAYGSKVVGRYVHPHRLTTASQTLDNDLYHFSPGYGFTELGPPDKNGMREIIATSFHDDGLPLVRFQTGDLVPEDDVPDSGVDGAFPWLAVDGFTGRSDEFIVSRSGTKVWPAQLKLDETLSKKIVAIQFFQDRPGSVLLRYSSVEGLTENERKQIKRKVGAALGRNFKVSTKRTRWPRTDERGALKRVNRTEFAIPSRTSRTKKKSTA